MGNLKQLLKYLWHLLTKDAAKEYRECEQMIENCWEMLEDCRKMLGGEK